MNPSEALQLAAEAVRAASRVTKQLQDKLPEDLSPKTKSDSSPVTIADFAAQAIVGMHLKTSFVGEESTALLETQDDLRKAVLEAVRMYEPSVSESVFMESLRLGEGEPQSTGFWTLDPVDGTKGFLRGAHYCLALARIEHGHPTVGVLGCPRLSARSGQIDGDGALFWALRGQPAYCSDMNEDSKAEVIQTPHWTAGSDVLLTESAEAAHSDQDLAPQLLTAAQLVGGPPVRLDSQVKYAVVARGEAQILLRKPKGHYVEKIWDHAAGSLIAEMAGCQVTDLFGQKLDFTHGRRLEKNRGLLVAPSALHPRLLDAFRSLDVAI